LSPVIAGGAFLLSLLGLWVVFPLPHALSAFADSNNPGVVIIAVVPRVIIMITPQNEFCIIHEIFLSVDYKN
jgi:uncharacterized membrane protein